VRTVSTQKKFCNLKIVILVSFRYIFATFRGEPKEPLYHTHMLNIAYLCYFNLSLFFKNSMLYFYRDILPVTEVNSFCKGKTKKVL
jgi:hypothetical protein